MVILKRAAMFCVLFGACHMISACAPTQARGLREARPFTVALLGVAARPNGNVGAGVALGYTGDKSFAVKSGDSGIKARLKPDNFADDDARVINQKSATTISPFVHFYPMVSSAFFLGAGASYTKSRYGFKEHNTEYSVSSQTTDVEYEKTLVYARMPVGWAWIWNNGFSLTLDFGPALLMSRNGHYNSGGDGMSGVDIAKRDSTRDTVESLDPKFRVIDGINTMIGYSF